ncbi:MAG: MBL fold metallo-hydrolase [Chloroflexi bacterium]|nr:MBL fold metallo-hydrolase [Chloroflexota bacterium]
MGWVQWSVLWGWPGGLPVSARNSFVAEVVQDSAVRITRLELGPFGTNSYVLVCQATNDSLVVDAPGDADRVLDELKGTNPRLIVITHDHFDHIVGLDELGAKLKVPVAIHPLDAGSLSFTPDIKLADGGVLELGKLKLKVLHTPGHTAGSVCLLVGKYLIAGDTIFPGGPGKTGSPAALEQIINSIVSKIFVLPDETEVYPGHGGSTVLWKEKKEFAIFGSKAHDPNLCGDVLWLSS